MVSLVIMDLKAWDPARHKQLTGMDNGPTLDFARRLADRKRPVWLRFVVVPGLTDDVDDIRRIAAFAGSLGNVERLDVLPFHQMGRYKWHALGMKYSLETVEPPTPALMDQTIAIFKAEGIRAV